MQETIREVPVEKLLALARERKLRDCSYLKGDWRGDADATFKLTGLDGKGVRLAALLELNHYDDDDTPPDDDTSPEGKPAVDADGHVYWLRGYPGLQPYRVYHDFVEMDKNCKSISTARFLSLYAQTAVEEALRAARPDLWSEYEEAQQAARGEIAAYEQEQLRRKYLGQIGRAEPPALRRGFWGWYLECLKNDAYRRKVEERKLHEEHGFDHYVHYRLEELRNLGFRRCRG